MYVSFLPVPSVRLPHHPPPPPTPSPDPFLFPITAEASFTLLSLFVLVSCISSLPQEVCHRVCHPQWCAALIGSAEAVSRGDWLFNVFVLFSLQ